MVEFYVKNTKFQDKQDKLITIACSFESDIYVFIKKLRYNVKSIMNMQTIGQADELYFEIEGVDEKEASESIKSYFEKQKS